MAVEVTYWGRSACTLPGRTLALANDRPRTTSRIVGVSQRQPLKLFKERYCCLIGLQCRCDRAVTHRERASRQNLGRCSDTRGQFSRLTCEMFKGGMKVPVSS